MIHGVSRDARYIADKIVAGGRPVETASLRLEERAIAGAEV
jgi:hypothetical protein